MKRIVIIMLCMLPMLAMAQPQTGGEIGAKNNAGTRGVIKRDADALKVNDSTLKVRLDSLLVYQRGDSSVQADILDWTSSYLPSLDSRLTTIVAQQISGVHMTQLRDSTGDKVQVTSDGKMYVTSSQSGTWDINNLPLKVNDGNALSDGFLSYSYDSGVGEVHPLQSRNSDRALMVYTPDTVKVQIASGTNLSSQYSEEATTSPAIGTLALARYKSSAPTLTDGKMYGLQLDASGNLKVTGSFSSTAGATVIYDSTVTAASMTVTNLNSVANSATVGWQSARVSNVSAKASDYKISVKLTMANTAPANDKAVYVYVCPHYTTDGGSTWLAASQGTTTLPTGSEGATTIASPNNLRLLGVLSYTTQNMVLQDNFLISNAFGNVMPDGFQIIIIDYSGAAISASGNSVHYSPIYKTQR